MITNDFKLKNMGNGLFDIEIENHNLINVTDNEQVRNSVILALFTIQDEISEGNPIYTGFGSRLNELVKTNTNSMTKHLITEYIRESLLKVHGISEIADITVDELNNSKFKVHINLITDDNLTESYDFELETGGY